jgi:hypothetical protein
MLWGLRTPPMAEDRTPSRRRMRRRRGTMRGRRGTRRVRGCTTRGWGDGSTSGSASSHRFRSSKLVRPPIAPHDDNRVVIIPCGDR